MRSIASKQTTVQPQRLPLRSSALPGPQLQREPLGAPKNSLGGFMINNFNSITSCFVKGVENSIALHGRILYTGINDLMSKGRFSESTHPVYKGQDASRTPGPGGRAGHRAEAPRSPALPLPRENSSHRGSAPRRAGQEDLPFWPGLSACEAVLVLSGQRFRGWPAPRGVASRFPLTHCTGICRIHELESTAAGVLVPPRKKRLWVLFIFYYYFLQS